MKMTELKTVLFFLSVMMLLLSSGLCTHCEPIITENKTLDFSASLAASPGRMQVIKMLTLNGSSPLKICTSSCCKNENCTFAIYNSKSHSGNCKLVSLHPFSAYVNAFAPGMVLIQLIRPPHITRVTESMSSKPVTSKNLRTTTTVTKSPVLKSESTSLLSQEVESTTNSTLKAEDSTMLNSSNSSTESLGMANHSSSNSTELAGSSSTAGPWQTSAQPTNTSNSTHSPFTKVSSNRTVVHTSSSTTKYTTPNLLSLINTLLKEKVGLKYTVTNTTETLPSTSPVNTSKNFVSKTVHMSTKADLSSSTFSTEIKEVVNVLSKITQEPTTIFSAGISEGEVISFTTDKAAETNRSDGDSVFNAASWGRSHWGLSAALITALSVGILFFIAIVGLVVKRAFDRWQRRHYSRIDYLVNGMYG